MRSVNAAYTYVVDRWRCQFDTRVRIYIQWQRQGYKSVHVDCQRVTEAVFERSEVQIQGQTKRLRRPY